jgi:hypothetical protein
MFHCITHFTLRLDADEKHTPKPLMDALSLSNASPILSPIPPILPQLQTLSFDHEIICTLMLCDLVSIRVAAGQPLRSLQLPRAILHDMVYASSLNWLREHVEVGKYQAEESEDEDFDI